MQISHPFLIGAGHLDETKMEFGARALADAWGKTLIPHRCSQQPDLVLSSLSADEGISQLIGDAAIALDSGGTWIEALAAWRIPVALIVAPLQSGEIPGNAAAYAALCKQCSVRFLGLIQLGGFWNQAQRKSDGLSWCGWINDQENLPLDHNVLTDFDAMDPMVIVEQLDRRLKILKEQHQKIN